MTACSCHLLLLLLSVNGEMVDLPPMMQFGWALLRILQTIARSDPRLGPVFLSRIDVADAF
jgi:hypothetical protein